MRQIASGLIAVALLLATSARAQVPLNPRGGGKTSWAAIPRPQPTTSIAIPNSGRLSGRANGTAGRSRMQHVVFGVRRR